MVCREINNMLGIILKSNFFIALENYAPVIVIALFSLCFWLVWKYMVRKIFKLTVISFIGPFIVTFFVVLFFLVMQFLWKYVDDLVGKGLEWYMILQLLLYSSATFVPLALPLAVLLSSIMSFGKIAETNELLALKSSGASLVRVMVPLITIVAIISVGAFFFSDDIIPRANLKFWSLLYDMQQKRPALDIREGVYYNGCLLYTSPSPRD